MRRDEQIMNFTWKMVVAIVIIVLVMLVVVFFETISTEKTEARVKEKDGIETISLGEHEYRVDSKRDIVFCDDRQVYSSKTGKPMTAKEFNSTLDSKKETKTIKLVSLFWTPCHNDGSWFIDDKNIIDITYTWGEGYNVRFSDGTTGHYDGDTYIHHRLP